MSNPIDETKYLPEAVVIMASGGVDSTYLLWKLLNETTVPIHAHHISLQVHGLQRHDCEGLAFQRITKYLNDNIRPFSWTTSVIGYESFPYRGWDTDTQLLMGARCAANLPAKKITVMLGVTADDNHKPIIQARIDRDVISTLWSALLNSIDPEVSKKINPELELPIGNMFKHEIVSELPDELLDLTWSCRQPVRENNTIRACGNCEPCKALKAIRKN